MKKEILPDLLLDEVKKVYPGQGPGCGVAGFLAKIKTGKISKLDGEPLTLNRENFYSYLRSGYMPEKFLDRICQELKLSTYCFIKSPIQPYCYRNRVPYEDEKRFNMFDPVKRALGFGSDSHPIDIFLYLFSGFSSEDLKRIPEEEKSKLYFQLYKKSGELEKKYLQTK